MVYISKSVEDTIRIGERLGRKLKAGDVVALFGNLGAGKTVMTKGIARGIGVKSTRYVNSPTFVIVKEHKGKMPLYHLDIYRLTEASVIDAESYEEYFYGDGVTVIEWADKIRKLLPKRRIEVMLSALGEDRRRIEIRKASVKR